MNIRVHLYLFKNNQKDVHQVFTTGVILKIKKNKSKNNFKKERKSIGYLESTSWGVKEKMSQIVADADDTYIEVVLIEEEIEKIDEV